MPVIEIPASQITDRDTAAVATLILGFLILTAGAYVGGDVVFLLGNMVSRHAFRGAGTKWIRLDTGDVADLATLPEATPTKMRAGINDLAVVRSMSDTIAVMHEGVIVEHGLAERVYTRPESDYTRALLAAVPVPDPKRMQERKLERRRLARPATA